MLLINIKYLWAFNSNNMEKRPYLSNDNANIISLLEIFLSIVMCRLNIRVLSTV